MKCQPLGEGLAVVRFDSLPGGGALSVVHERHALVVEAPKLAGDKSAVSGKEARRSCRLILVEWFAFGIGCGVTCGADVMQFEIGVSLDQNRPIVRSQARRRQHTARQIDGESWTTDWIVRRSKLQVR